jgi:hypothetical protein
LTVNGLLWASGYSVKSMLTKVEGKVMKDMTGPMKYQPPGYTVSGFTDFVIALYTIPYSIGSTVPILRRRTISATNNQHIPHPIKQIA